MRNLFGDVCNSNPKFSHTRFIRGYNTNHIINITTTFWINIKGHVRCIHAIFPGNWCGVWNCFKRRKWIVCEKNCFLLCGLVATDSNEFAKISARKTCVIPIVKVHNSQTIFGTIPFGTSNDHHWIFFARRREEIHRNSTTGHSIFCFACEFKDSNDWPMFDA